MTEHDGFDALIGKAQQAKGEAADAVDAWKAAEAEARPRVLAAREETHTAAKRVAKFFRIKGIATEKQLGEDLYRRKAFSNKRVYDRFVPSHEGWSVFETEVTTGTFYKDTANTQDRGILLADTGTLVMYINNTPEGNLARNPKKDSLNWRHLSNIHTAELADSDYTGDFSYVQHERLGIETAIQQGMINLLVVRNLIDQFARFSAEQ